MDMSTLVSTPMDLIKLIGILVAVGVAVVVLRDPGGAISQTIILLLIVGLVIYIIGSGGVIPLL